MKIHMCFFSYIDSSHGYDFLCVFLIYRQSDCQRIFLARFNFMKKKEPKIFCDILSYAFFLLGAVPTFSKTNWDIFCMVFYLFRLLLLK